jgi:serpin B
MNLKTKLGAYGTLQALAKASYEIRDVKVGLPRFRADSGADLTPGLRRLGLQDALTKGAAYPGLTNGKSQVVPSVFQRAVVEVTEEGTEAAAATVVGTPRDAGAPEPVAFVVDHPFYFGIFDNETGAVLFMGYVADPAT